MKKFMIFVSIIIFSIVSCDNRLLINPVDPESELYIVSARKQLNYIQYS